MPGCIEYVGSIIADVVGPQPVIPPFAAVAEALKLQATLNPSPKLPHPEVVISHNAQFKLVKI